MKSKFIILFLAFSLSAFSSFASYPVPNEKSKKSAKVSEQSLGINAGESVEIKTPPELTERRQNLEKKVNHRSTKSRLKAIFSRSNSNGAGWSIASFCCAMVGILVAALPLGICAIVFGAIGLSRRLKGLAIAGMALGILEVVAILLFVAAM